MATQEKNLITPHDTRYLFVLPFSTDEVLARRFLARDSQIVGNIRFGKLLETLDKVAENTALAYVHRLYPEARVVTAGVAPPTTPYFFSLPERSRQEKGHHIPWPAARAARRCGRLALIRLLNDHVVKTGILPYDYVKYDSIIL